MVLPLFKMTGQGGTGKGEGLVDITHYHPVRVRGKQKAHDAQLGFGPDDGQHVSVAGHRGGAADAHNSIILE